MMIGCIVGSDRGYVGIMEKKTETTIVYWGYYIGIIGLTSVYTGQF